MDCNKHRLVRVEKTVGGCKHGAGHGFGHLKHDTESIVYEEYSYLPQDWRRITRTSGKYSIKTDCKGNKDKGVEEKQTFVSLYDGDDESHEYLQTRNKFGFFGKCMPKHESLRLFREFIGGPETDDIKHTRYGRLSLAMLKDGLGSTVALTGRDGDVIAHIGYDVWGNFRYSDKTSKAPCGEDEFDGYLDRYENTRGFGSAEHNSHAFGMHFASKLTPYLYTGRRYSELTNQYFNRNRYYSPALGRFTSKDPLGFFGGANLYRYVDNNPVLFIDPMGLITINNQTEADQVKAEVINHERTLRLWALLFAYWKKGDTLETTLYNPDWVRSMGYEPKNDGKAGLIANASGYRGEYYKSSPQIIKNAIDEFEDGKLFLCVCQGLRCIFVGISARPTSDEAKEKAWMINIINEFERHQKFIQILEDGLNAWEKKKKQGDCSDQ